jgi:hypothetical protein
MMLATFHFRPITPLQQILSLENRLDYPTDGKMQNY